ncbi:hypothetical protein [Bacillus xiapuensis]|uniref:hypothetical protein n=1 Tax=Bacillus xiapuensis TaxID=2014075 RepID=UPI0018E24146|nr:hypothetical protein [Bacillus xiapuensis]
MKKFSWILTGMGMLLILGGILYPLDVIEKPLFITLLLGGALTMFIGTMFRAYAILRNK